MEIVHRIEQLVEVTPTAIARTGAHSMLRPHLATGEWPVWVTASDALGSTVAVVRVADASEAFVVVAKLLTLLAPASPFAHSALGPAVEVRHDVRAPLAVLDVAAA
jgi:hypothetical protein